MKTNIGDIKWILYLHGTFVMQAAILFNVIIS